MISPAMAPVVLLAAALVASGVPSEASDEFRFTDEQLQASIVPLADEVSALSPSVTPVETVEEDQGQTIITLQSDILFAFAESGISKNAKEKIIDLVEDVPQDATVDVGGHTDSIGDDASNLKLSEERAQNVASVIGKARPDLSLTVEGFGESRPVEANEQGGEDNPEGRAANRRVEIRYGG